MTFARRVRQRGPAPYPTLWRVVGNRIVDRHGFDLGIAKGFNTNVASTVGNPAFMFSQAEFDSQSALTNGAAVKGPGINRIVICWDVFEQSAGVYHGISSATGAATAGSAFDSLDKTLERLTNAGRYAFLEIHLLGGVAGARCPTWAQTGSSPSGAGNAWSWFCTNGQGITQVLAQRYGDPASSKYAPCVVGFFPNEPPAVLQTELMTGHETIIPWYRSIAPLWPIWVSPFSYGGGTPYPGGAGAGAADIDTSRLLALDPGDRGIILDWHNYLNMTGSASSDGYQANGGIGPVEQVTNGAQFYGWGTAYTYPDTTASRTAIANHIAPIAQLKNVNSKIALGMTEFGNDNQAQGASHDAWIRDTINAIRAAGGCVEIWWQFASDQNTFNSGSTVGSGWRAGISGTPWMQNTTPRAA